MGRTHQALQGESGLTVTIRTERACDIDAIRNLTTRAFANAPHSSGTEAAIVDALRAAGALTVSFVADGDGIAGHVAFSPVTINGTSGGWYGLGPVSVDPHRQNHGIGAMLIRAGLQRLQDIEARGCVVLGDPAYYRRFGFEADPGLTYPGVPPEYFMALTFRGPSPSGDVSYHPAFDTGS